ncbi:hypothetical protein H6G00_33085 [Leptolyngbya sp. FACHB-541]|uniref:hypothetical protein n=1 Tax=Leptolyngbya sp. FACHB-541 TaxID=2692810 RepID=UPI001684276E|nr:hypothetical protein [Leptolyngbya sp. FACHB-541]MBD2001376.1 hypothetical protein [Leptolyngbya sp. FACHB-541]
MLVFFIHGVATRDVKYADPLKRSIQESCAQLGKALPHFYSCFWGNALNDVSRMWNLIHQDLQNYKKKHPQSDIQDIFRYQTFREGFLSEFVGDMFTYLNPKRGVEIRKAIAQQLLAFIKDHPEETELHIVSHSLGTVILWDILFSEKFHPKDPAFYIRSVINGLEGDRSARKLQLKSITTMGSPILFFNTMLGISPERVKEFTLTYKNDSLRWLNVIHSSDVIAYPLGAGLAIDETYHLSHEDVYVSTDANFAEKAARSIGQMEAAMALGAGEAHVSYWNCGKTSSSIVCNILDIKEANLSGNTSIQSVIALLENVSGMTCDQMRLHVNDNPANSLSFKDGSGRLHHVINVARIHHVYIFDHNNLCQFSGYVGWVHTDSFLQALLLLEKTFCCSSAS